MLEQLRRDVESLCGSSLQIEYVEHDNSHGLSIDRSTKVTKDEKIFILNSLPLEFRIQAEAHELAHLYLKYSGLIRIEFPFDYGYPVSEDYLALEINNALSHVHLVPLLQNKYGISSQIHLDLQGSALEYVPDQIMDRRLNQDEICLHGIGVVLYDIEKTIPKFSALIKDIANMDPAVKQAWKQAHQYFPLIEPTLNRDHQRLLLQNFLKSLGYPDYKFCYRFI